MKELGFLMIITSLLLSGCIWTTPEGKKSLLPQFTANLLADQRNTTERFIKGNGNQDQVELGVDLLALKRTAPALGASFKVSPLKTVGSILADTAITAGEMLVGFKTGEAAVDWAADEFGSKSDETTVVNPPPNQSRKSQAKEDNADSGGQLVADSSDARCNNLHITGDNNTINCKAADGE